ncbi:conserved hypothetical protein [Trichormus variabilis ATCC 29413]|uniref:EcsC family protein n=2 Tax=Anabaena variabilis TaxID=264691 RepID=Q3M9J7_TRIV2|nr:MULTISPECIES: hypothetical protein [Nostocaceae]ABA22339.1 conserved hypothetical protein [Trichormus variabilis ATCC 29413]MBC1217527.1 hypothetical protein [Trichormus variabilis ARAD]MBC1258339.1 hypothetical protein [Trichormus variabilis V5]MBC1269853.1 hypothetical protein [Trichormus variabilis FSR]MBC1304556.1 hypothetical protein [Trichormus variabilis N2B]
MPDKPPANIEKNTKPSVIDAVAQLGQATVKQTQNLFEQGTQITGNFINHLSDNWLIRKISGFLNLNWLIGASDNVDLEKVAASVNKLKQKYPQESPSQIAHRIMMDKAAKSGGVGLASSILPGVAAALFAVDLAATMKLQTEMLYQIAAAYGLDLKDPARKGELLTIFGLGLGGNRLLKAAGLALLRNIPFAGAAIAASSNATLSYSLGYAACRFYEAKLDAATSLNSPETLANLKAESEKYLEKAIAQEAIMDQILVHMILASHPEKTWEEILPDLQVANLSPTSLAAIKQNIKSPQPFEQLLNQLNRDFAVPSLARCRKIAELDHQTKPRELEIINAIAKKFDIGQ